MNAFVWGACMWAGVCMFPGKQAKEMEGHCAYVSEKRESEVGEGSENLGRK